MVKKVFLTIFAVLLVAIVGVVGYGAKIYFDVKGTINNVQGNEKLELSPKREKAISLDNSDAFSILLLGIDTDEGRAGDTGRSDTTIVVTVNPKANKTTMISIPRDTYTEIVGLNQSDKINHAYAFGGVEMAVRTVENLLDMPIDHYVSINMEGLVQLVDAVDGVDVENTLEFSQGGFNFPLGSVHLTGESALSFSRMRYEDPKGDYGRQLRQQQVVEAIVKKSMSVNTLTTYRQMLTAVESNVQMDLSWDDLMDLQKKYLGAFKTIDHETLQGQGVMRDGVSYQDISDEELTRVRGIVKEQLTN